MKLPDLDLATIDRVIEMAWEDRTPFQAIEIQFGLKEKEVRGLSSNCTETYAKAKTNAVQGFQTLLIVD